MKELVSVIIPTYKRSDTLPRAIDSVLNQDYDNIEIIVVDDNDPNTEYRKKTEQLMEEYSDESKVIYLKHEHNKNGSAARNTGFKASKGQYIMFLDDDDEFLRNKVLSQLEILKSKDDTWGACYSAYIRMKNEKIIMKSAERREGDMLIEELKRNFFVHAGSNLMIRRKVVEELNGFDESFQRNQDIEFLVRLLRYHKIAYCGTTGLIVHVHERIMKQTFDELTYQYTEKFKSYINSFNDDVKADIYRMLNLQRFRWKIIRISTFKEAMDMLAKKEVLFIDVIRYMAHLALRRLTKRSYGFRM